MDQCSNLGNVIPRVVIALLTNPVGATV